MCSRRRTRSRWCAQKEATAEQLAQAKRNFEVGTATITDTHEAQARYDLNSAQEIAALNDLESKRRALQILTGREIAELRRCADVRLKSAQSARYGGLGRHRGKKRLPHPDRGGCRRSGGARGAAARAAHLPTLDFVATHGQRGASATSDSRSGATRRTR